MSASHIDTITIARPYATAIFAQALETKKQDVIAQQFTTLADAIAGNAELSKALSNPLVSREQKLSVLTGLAKGADALTLKSLGLVAEGGRADIIPAISALLNEALAKHKDELSAIVTSARPLNDATKKQLKASLAKATGKETQVAFQENPELLGGLVVELGSLRLDASLSGALHQMRAELTAPAA